VSTNSLETIRRVDLSLAEISFLLGKREIQGDGQHETEVRS